MDAPTFLGLEPLIINRLIESPLTDLGVRVLAVKDFGSVAESSLPKPSVRVAFVGHRILADNGPVAPGWARVEQTWLIVPAVRNVREMQTGAAAREDISPLIDIAFDALDGWPPGNGFGVLTSVTPGAAPSVYEGSLFVPLAFTSTFRRRRTCA